MQAQRIIRKYKNRKLYDTVSSRYVTLGEIAALIKQGVDLKVLDHQSEEDLTGMVLTEILYDQERSKAGLIPVETLANLIVAKGSSVFEFMQKFIAVSMDSAANRFREAERYIDGLVDKDILSKAEGKSLLKELQASEKAASQELEQHIAGAVSRNVEKFDNFSNLQDRIDSLTRSVEDLEKKLS